MTWKPYPYVALSNKQRDAFTYRPMLDIQVAIGEESMDFKALVDSGTDVTMMDLDIAKALGVDLENCKKGKVGGVGGERIGYLHLSTIIVPGF